MKFLLCDQSDLKIQMRTLGHRASTNKNIEVKAGLMSSEKRSGKLIDFSSRRLHFEQLTN